MTTPQSRVFSFEEVPPTTRGRASSNLSEETQLLLGLEEKQGVEFTAPENEDFDKFASRIRSRVTATSKQSPDFKFTIRNNRENRTVRCYRVTE